ncbi:MAG TPA: class I SAM-dependent methyltransferase [Kribbella sp.]|nr:class I SAM-dependent methyltransferase [Kribbella sp.]
MRIATVDELLQLLDNLHAQRADATSRAASDHWDEVLQREGHPLNTDLPDISLLTWREAGLLPLQEMKTVLDVGCGLGRNSRWFAGLGASVTGVDIATSALAAARRRSEGSAVDFLELDFLREVVPGAPFDFVYDSGCFHHLAPHRRISYMRSLQEALAPGGYFGISTFTAGKMGSDAPDDVLMRSGRLGEGVGYTEAELAQMFSWLDLVGAGPMPGPQAVREPAFTHDFLTVALFRSRPTSHD